jgi:hypothetical protein
MYPFGKITTTACILWALGAPLPTWAQSLSLTVEENILTLQARKIPLRNILQEITAQTGIAIETEGNIETPISASFSGIPLEEGLKRITPEFNTVIFYGDAKNAPQGAMKAQKISLYSKTNSPSARGGPNTLSSIEDTPMEALVIRADGIPDLELHASHPPELDDIIKELGMQQEPPSLEELGLEGLGGIQQEPPSLEDILPLELPQ